MRRYVRFSQPIAAIAVGFLLSAGCVPRPAAPPHPPSVTVSALLKRLAIDAETFQSLKGVARVKVSNATRSFTATQVLLAKKPDRLRAEVLSFFGQPVFLMATNGTELTVLSATEGKFYRGAATARNLRRILRVPLYLTDLVPVLLYQVPLIDHARQRLVPGEKGGYILTLFGEEDRRQTLVFDGELRLVKAVYFHAEKPVLQVTYGKFADQKGHSFPQEIFLKMPSLQTDASVVFSDLRTNVAIPESRFILNPPAGVQVLPIP